MTSFIRYELHWRADRAKNWQAHSAIVATEDEAVQVLKQRRWQICKAYVKKIQEGLQPSVPCGDG